MANETNNNSDEDQLKPALWASIGPLVDSTLGLEYGANASPQFIGALTELVYAQIEGVAGDVESFARFVVPSLFVAIALLRRALTRRHRVSNYR